MLINQEHYSTKEVEQAKRDIQSLVNKKSKDIKIDLKKKEDIKIFTFNNIFREIRNEKSYLLMFYLTCFYNQLFSIIVTKLVKNPKASIAFLVNISETCSS